MTKILQTALVLSLGLQMQSAFADEVSWSDSLVAPVANPIFFETPTINSELRPIFVYHELNDNFAIPGTVKLYAAQLRLQLTDRLALIATKDGFIEIDPDNGASVDGWADIGGGLKYALIKSEDSKFILTPGVKFEVPTGDDEVFQGNGDGEFDLFVSAAKGLGEFQIMGSAGVRLPLDTDEETSQLHYSVQLAYPVCEWFKPFVVLNGYTVLSEGSGPAFGSEGYDVINFGTSNAQGETQIVLGAGFRASLCECFDLGVAYEEGVDHSDGIFDRRVTADLVWKF
jgi:hypothetical protein